MPARHTQQTVRKDKQQEPERHQAAGQQQQEWDVGQTEPAGSRSAGNGMTTRAHISGSSISQGGRVPSSLSPLYPLSLSCTTGASTATPPPNGRLHHKHITCGTSTSAGTSGATPTSWGTSLPNFPPPPSMGAPGMGGMLPNMFPSMMPPFMMPFGMSPPMPPPNFSGLSDEELRAMEGMERQHVQARIECLKNIQSLLDAAVIQMQQYSTLISGLGMPTVPVTRLPHTTSATSTVPPYSTDRKSTYPTHLPQPRDFNINAAKPSESSNGKREEKDVEIVFVDFYREKTSSVLQASLKDTVFLDSKSK
eukprot:XP_011676470.1 PREDICTED: E3 ubiquitin-protein ligase synoviolin B-like [Strongylocentrotus purpuratus]